MEFEIEKDWLNRDSDLLEEFKEPDKFLLFSKLNHTLGKYIYIVDIDIPVSLEGYEGAETSKRFIISNVFEAVRAASSPKVIRNNISVLEVPDFTGQSYNILNLEEVIEARDIKNNLAVILCFTDGRRKIIESRFQKEEELTLYNSIYSK